MEVSGRDPTRSCVYLGRVLEEAGLYGLSCDARLGVLEIT